MELSRPPQVFRSLLQDGDLCSYRVEVSKSPRSRGLQGSIEYRSSGLHRAEVFRTSQSRGLQGSVEVVRAP